MKKLILLILIFCPILVLAQDVMTVDTTATRTVNGTIDQMLKIVNGEPNKLRNWDAFRNLFLPSVRFTVVHDGSEKSFESANLDEMIEFMKDDYYDNGYKEESIHRKVDQYNGISQVWEVVKHVEPDGTEIMGLNSYQLIYSEQRWWISNLIWTTEVDGQPIPKKYLKN